jgi:hypothetical protein
MKKPSQKPQIFAEQVAEIRKLSAAELKKLHGGRRADPNQTYTNVTTSTGWFGTDSDLDGQVD